jgi:hypothetical protein
VDECDFDSLETKSVFILTICGYREILFYDLEFNLFVRINEELFERKAAASV